MEPLTMAIDTHNLFWRTWHVGKNNPDENRTFFAVYEFISYLIRLNRDYAPARVILAWDEPPYFRNEMYPAYKANREKEDGNWATQLHLIREVTNEAGIASLSKPGLEADDVLASIGKRSDNCLIISSDKDLLALVSATTTVELLRWTKLEGTHRKRFSSRMDVKEFFGVFPEQVSAYKAFAGDNSDNVPGVTGVGHKKAVYLLENFMTFQGVYDHLHCLTTASGRPMAMAKALRLEHEWVVLYKTICTPLVDDSLVIPEAKPLSVKALSEALKDIPHEEEE